MTGSLAYNLFCALLALGVLGGIAMMSRVATAAKGNALSAVCVAAAIILTLSEYGIVSLAELWICMGVGLAAGLLWAARISMMEMPQVVALLNGFGGAASALVAIVSLADSRPRTLFASTTSGLALAVGMITFTGSLVAAGKLHGLLSQKPVLWRRHREICALLPVLTALGVGASDLGIPAPAWAVALCALASALFGAAFAVRVGGADMPVTISLLNSLSGVAGSIAGMALGDPLLVAVGGIVGASGLLLTQIMCRAMNRSLPDLLLGRTTVTIIGREAAPMQEGSLPPTAQPPSVTPPPGAILREAKRVIIVPGYGMALAQAQRTVAELAERLERRGARVDFAIHPVAGRMPGHMNVLLAEADVPYEKLREMDDINPEFPECDLAVVIGANDVINPAANSAEGTPIHGMPILRVDQARHIIICNYDRKPGYAGVANPLYERKDAILLFGDAAETVRRLAESI